MLRRAPFARLGQAGGGAQRSLPRVGWEPPELHLEGSVCHVGGGSRSLWQRAQELLAGRVWVRKHVQILKSEMKWPGIGGECK